MISLQKISQSFTARSGVGLRFSKQELDFKANTGDGMLMGLEEEISDVENINNRNNFNNEELADASLILPEREKEQALEIPPYKYSLQHHLTGNWETYHI